MTRTQEEIEPIRNAHLMQRGEGIGDRTSEDGTWRESKAAKDARPKIAVLTPEFIIVVSTKTKETCLYR